VFYARRAFGVDLAANDLVAIALAKMLIGHPLGSADGRADLLYLDE